MKTDAGAETINKYPVSIFQYEKGAEIIKMTAEREHDSTCSPGEKPVTTALYKYGFMNLDMLKKNMAYMGHKRLDVAQVLKKMQMQGKVDRYTVRYETDRANLDIYTLNMEFEKKLRKNEAAIYQKDMKDIPYILENMALCQWHNSLLSSKRILTEIIYSRTKCCSYGFVIIPSVIRIKVGKHGIYLCAVPVNRSAGLPCLKNFVVNLTKINRYFEENQDRYRSYLIVLLCESISQIRELAKLLAVMKETKELELLYTVDMAVYAGEPLDNLYSIKRTGGGAELALVEL